MTDERGLFLLIHTNGGKYWRFNYRFAGKRKTLALGELSPKKKKPKKQDLLTNIAVEVLAGGKVLTTDQILNELACRNFVVSGENPSGNLSAILSKGKQFIYSRSAKGWMLVSAMEKVRPVDLP